MKTFETLRLGGPKAGEKRGLAPMISFALPLSMKTALTAFARRERMSRSQAMRTLITLGLQAKERRKHVT